MSIPQGELFDQMKYLHFRKTLRSMQLWVYLTLLTSFCPSTVYGQEQPKEPVNPRAPGPIPEDVLKDRASAQSSPPPVSRLGLGVEEVSSQSEGLRVLIVVKGSPAERAGLKAGDVLEHYNDQLLIAPKQLEILVKRCPVGTEIVLGVTRDDEAFNIPVTLEAARPSLPPSPIEASRDFEITRRVVRLIVGSGVTCTTVELSNQGQQATLFITAEDAVKFDGPVYAEAQIPPRLRQSIEQVAILDGGKWFFRLPDPPPVSDIEAAKPSKNIDK